MRNKKEILRVNGLVRNVSIKLLRSAVLWDAPKTAEVRSFMDTLPWGPKSVHITAKVRSFVDI